jgi:opacity protein-like surface antigen
MKRILITAVAAFALFVPAALADVSSDMQKLASDAKTAHDTVIADAQKVASDAQSLMGTKDKASAKTLLQADMKKL